MTRARASVSAAGRWLVAFLWFGACSSDTPTRPSPQEPALVAVVFRYVSPVPPGMPPSDPLNWTGWVHHFALVARPSPTVQGSWSSNLYRPIRVTDEGTLIAVPDVPVGTEHVVQVWDLQLCNVDASADPVSFRTICATGVELTRVITHPSGMKGAAFRVAPDGTVTP